MVWVNKEPRHSETDFAETSRLGYRNTRRVVYIMASTTGIPATHRYEHDRSSLWESRGNNGIVPARLLKPLTCLMARTTVYQLVAGVRS